MLSGTLAPSNLGVLVVGLGDGPGAAGRSRFRVEPDSSSPKASSHTEQERISAPNWQASAALLSWRKGELWNEDKFI